MSESIKACSVYREKWSEQQDYEGAMLAGIGKSYGFLSGDGEKKEILRNNFSVHLTQLLFTVNASFAVFITLKGRSLFQ